MFPLSIQGFNFLTLQSWLWRILVKSPLDLCFAFKQMTRDFFTLWTAKCAGQWGLCVWGGSRVSGQVSIQLWPWCKCQNIYNHFSSLSISVCREKDEEDMFLSPFHCSVFLKLLPRFILNEPSLKYPELFNSISVHPVPSAAVSAMYFSPDEIPLPRRYLRALS